MPADVSDHVSADTVSANEICVEGFGSTTMPSRTKLDPITILLVDDDDQLREFCRNLLAANGFRVLEADNGLEALLIATQHQGAIHLLITDLVMPRISGVKLGRAFKEIWPGVNVLYVSGSPRETVGGELPPDCAFLPKPFVPGALVKAVENCIQPPETFSD
jgi:two-component system cell cycle sensor histidine kinase/response regulator CckA